MDGNVLNIYVTIKYPEGIEKIWLDKFGTEEKPHCDEICKYCGMSAGEHLYPSFDCPPKQE